MKTVMLYCTVIAFALLFIGAPLVIFFRWIYQLFDVWGMKIDCAIVPADSWSEAPLVVHAGAYELESSSPLYLVEFTINGKKFKETTSLDTYLSSADMEVKYVVGKSGKTYIKNVQ
jgi:hypothetical protein